MDLEKYVDKKISDKIKNYEYTLFGVNMKLGESNKNGHYYCYTYINNDWHYFNDTEVYKETLNFSSKEVVGLFYRK